MGILNERQVIDRIRALSAGHGGQTRLARKAGLSAQHINDVIRGRRRPHDKLLAVAGIIRCFYLQKRSRR